VCLRFKAVVFDLYETLVTQSKTVVPRGGALGESLGLNPAAYRREWKQLRPQILRGQLTFQQALVEIGKRLDTAIPAERVQRASDERARANTEVFQKIDGEVVALLGAIRDLGIRLATISNCMAEDVVAWPRSVLASHFSCAVFSFEAGVVKPDTRIYLHAIERLGVPAQDALYVGDGGDDELAGAERAGLRAARAAWYVTEVSPSPVPSLATPGDALRLIAEGSVQ
jgi:HAD superfamily hydrolase (TIGR01549 family)